MDSISETCNVTNEVLLTGGLSLPQAARKFPPYRKNRPVSPSTIFRWIRDGVVLASGDRLWLEGIRLSGRWLTSEQALARFISAQTPQFDAGQTPVPRSPSVRASAAERAGRALERHGIGPSGI